MQVCYFLYKNLLFGLTIFFFNGMCFFSGQILYNGMFLCCSMLEPRVALTMRFCCGLCAACSCLASTLRVCVKPRRLCCSAHCAACRPR